MGKKLEYTPNSKIRQDLRKLWLWSRERNKALKRDKYTCVKCHRKQSKKKGEEFKVEVHHTEGILNWDKLFEVIRLYLLCDSKYLETMCKECHEEEEKKRIAKKTELG